MANSSTTPKNRDDHGNSPTLEKAKETGSHVMDKAREVGSQAMDKAREAASSVGGMVSQAASNVGKTADNLTSSAGSSIRNLGDTLSQNAPREGMLGTASQTVANTLRDGGRYLEESGISGVAEDVTNLIRRNPMPAILIGIGVGFLIGRAMRS